MSSELVCQTAAASRSMSFPVRPLARGGAVVGVVAAVAPPAARVRPAAVTRGPRDDERHFETIIRGAVARQCLAGSRSHRADQELLPALRHAPLGLDSFSKLPERRRARHKEVAWLPG